jgi:hypothetical protein
MQWKYERACGLGFDSQVRKKYRVCTLWMVMKIITLLIERKRNVQRDGIGLKKDK